MPIPERWRKPAACISAALSLTAVALLTGRSARLAWAPRPARSPLPPGPALLDGAAEAEAAIADASLPEASAESVVYAQRKRIMGRLRSLEHVRRVATTIRPLVDRALEQPAVQEDLRYLADRAGISIPQYKKYFAGKEEADLLLESGGDPDARSSAGALGVAQFLAGTGQRAGLRIDLAASNALSHKIAVLEDQVAWLQAQPATFVRAVPPALARVIPTVPAPPAAQQADASAVPAAPAPEPAAPAPVPASEGTDVGPAVPAAAPSTPDPVPPPAAAPPTPKPPATTVWTRDQWVAYRQGQVESLRAKRRLADERYDAGKAIRVQCRYLLRLTRRYGGVDWALQAYHGGEAGVERTQNLFAASGGVRTLLASRSLDSVPGLSLRGPSYGETYRHLTPAGAPAAFGYVFGRADDHRYYWWKTLMAEKALDLYRKDPDEFRKQWQALRPGLSADAAYYAEPEQLQFADNAALEAAYHDGTLVTLPRVAKALGVRTENVAALAPESAPLQKGLRPEAMGALLRIAAIYQASGAREPLTVLSMVQSNGYRALWNARYPAPPPPPDVPRDPEFHTTGLAFDLRRPAQDWNRKVLEFALGRLYDSLRISWRKEGGASSLRYHVIVNPQFKGEMAAYYHRAAGR